MTRVSRPDTVSSAFGIDPSALDDLGVLDVTLAIDTRLFIDPLLLPDSRHREINTDAVAQYRAHFEEVIKLLAASTVREDVAWRSARHHLSFHEIRGTCLGYGAGSIAGSGFGPGLTNGILNVGKEIVNLGIRDPDLFPALALFEATIGPDRISDMVATVIRRALITFNARILSELELEGERFSVLGDDGIFLSNPTQTRRTPIILVPTDVLRPLPIAGDWDEVADAASHNEALRGRVNRHIGEIWECKSKRDKTRLRNEVLASEAAFQTLLDTIHAIPKHSYDSYDDAEGLIRWSRVAREFAEQFPLALLKGPVRDLDQAQAIVQKIIDRYRQLIEKNGLAKELYRDSGRPRHESTAQRLFFAIAYCYCEANDLDISPEVDSGTGHIDFKFSNGFHCRILVEVKLSTNSKLLPGYSKQLEAYKSAEQTMRAFYLVIDVGKMGKKLDRLTDIRNEVLQDGHPLSELEYIDGIPKVSASKLK